MKQTSPAGQGSLNEHGVSELLLLLQATKTPSTAAMAIRFARLLRACLAIAYAEARFLSAYQRRSSSTADAKL